MLRDFLIDEYTITELYTDQGFKILTCYGVPRHTPLELITHHPGLDYRDTILLRGTSVPVKIWFFKNWVPIFQIGKLKCSQILAGLCFYALVLLLQIGSNVQTCLQDVNLICFIVKHVSFEMNIATPSMNHTCASHDI